MKRRTMLKCFAATVVAAVLGLSARAANPPEEMDLFRAGEGGYHTYRIPVLITSVKGTLLAFCEGRKNSSGDTGDVDLLLKRSPDGGETWTGQQLIWSDGANVCGNPAPVVDRETGIIWLFLTWNLGTDNERAIQAGTSSDTRRVFLTRSRDDGRTWDEPHEITSAVKRPGWRWYATGPANGIQLMRGEHKGRLVIPANHSDHADPARHPFRAHVIYSDDHGRTWQIGGVEEEKTNESAVIELADGSLLQNMRSYHGKNRRAIARSRDGGRTWSEVTLDPALVEPVCQASLLRYSWPKGTTPGRILFSNPASTTRERMTVRLSRDECGSWPISRVLWKGPSAYSSLAVLPGGSIACLYECGTKTPYEKIALARFSIEWLEGSE